MKAEASRGRVLLVASLPRYCAVCDGERVVRLVRVERARGAARARCPHCVSHVPVLHLPMRTDIPRNGAA